MYYNTYFVNRNPPWKDDLLMALMTRAKLALE